ncbi:MAG TPA: hypothetical protein VEX67_08670 [Solirubrobacteraceae bacterium]|nr:hypothetical protein [Solirubrobacteraceae bacterium]
MPRASLSWIVAALALGLGLARVGLVIADAGGPPAIAGVEAPLSDGVSIAAEAFLLVLFAATGALVAARRPRNPIGWLLLTTAVSFAALQFAERLGWHNLLADRAVGDRVADWLWVANWIWILAVAPIFIFIPLLFPTGRPLSRRWRVAVWGTAVIVASFVLTSALRSGPLENYTAVDNRFGVVSAGISEVLFALCGAAAFISVGSLALRFRRAHGVERQQIKWVWGAGTLLVVSFVASALAQGPLGEDADSILFVGLLAVPAAVAVAILRYRLYDIAVVVNRTLVYGSLTAALGLFYLGSVLLLQLILRPVTEESSLAVAVSTIAVAGLFRPARARIQELVDMRFYRRKYDAARTLQAFSARLRDERDLDNLNGELRTVLQETLQPSQVSLWLRSPD